VTTREIIPYKALEAEVLEERKFTEETLALARTMVVSSTEAYTMATEILQDVKRKYNALDARKKEITGPLQNALRSATALFQAPLQNLASVEAHIKGELARYTLAQEEARRAAMAKAAEEYAQGQTPLLGDVPEAAPQVKGVTVREVTKWEVTDADAVPRQFCSPDPKKIQAHLDAGGLEAIKGVRFYKDAQVAVRTK
jgi:hypothetical protein